MFAVQPMYAKLLLPKLGGGSSVWTACLLFFQTMLLAGYLYSFLISKLNSTALQAKVHTAVVLIAATLMPISNVWSQSAFIELQSPFWNIFSLLFFSIGIPYFVLSATAPLIQHWFGQTDYKSQTYKLYSVSNIAALLALFSYPFLIEYQLTLNQQTVYWSITYLAFTVAISLSIYTVYKQSKMTLSNVNFELINRAEPAGTGQQQKVESQSTGYLTMVTWFLLSATGVILLVATTSKMTQNIPPIPFLWIMPLAIYLLTFILTFHDERIYVRWYWLITFAVCSLIALLLFFIGTHFGVISQIVLYLVAMFVATMICHGELVKTKPQTNQLTLFYLILSAGGCAGSIFASIIATEIFSLYYEFIVGFAAVFAFTALSIFANNTNHSNDRKVAVASLFGLGIFSAFFLFLNSQFNQFNVYETRSFYGTLAVKDLTLLEQAERRLVDGYTSHGAQRLTSTADNRHLEPLSYYRPDSGIGLLLQTPYFKSKPNNVGLIGLGVGALAYYGQPNDTYTFYELNPDVADVALNYFDYLNSSKANTAIKLGDARVTLEHEMTLDDRQAFDLLVVDAFSSDSIPVHLLTKEAINLYRHHLSEQGLLAFHISNSYLDLKPVMRNIATQLSMTALYFKAESKQSDIHTTEWVIFTSDNTYLQEPHIKREASLQLMQPGLSVSWTDDFSSLLSVMKW